MTLLLTEADVRSLLTMPIALEIVEESLAPAGPRRIDPAPAPQNQNAGQRAAALHGGGRHGARIILA